MNRHQHRRGRSTAGLVLATALAGVLGTTVSTAALASAGAPHAAPATDGARAGAFRVTATVNKPEPQVREPFKVKGSVLPAAPGAVVKLQLRYAGQKRWKTVDTDTLNAESRFTFKDKAKTVRERSYRVVKPAGPNRAAGRSERLRVTVFGWRPLTSLTPASSAGFAAGADATINTAVFEDSLISFSGVPSPYRIDYNLNRDCKSLSGQVGLDDRSLAAGTATVAVTADGVQRYAGSFGLTQSQPVTVDVSGVFRISITASTADGGVAAVGSPQVLCSF